MRQGLVVVLFSFALAVWGPIEGSLFWALGLKLSPWVCAVGVGTVLATNVVLRVTGSVRAAGHWLAGNMYFIVLGCSLDTGGVTSSAIAWSASVPVFATMAAGRRAGRVWLLLVVVKVLGLALAHHMGVMPASEIAEGVQAVYDFCVLAGVAAMLTSLAWLYENEKDTALAAVDREARRVRDAHAHARRILDNVSEGLVMVDTQGRLLPGRSAQVDQWFGAPAEGARLWDWIAAGRTDTALALELGWQQLEQGVFPVDVALDQLPVELQSGDATFRLAYHPLMRDEAAEHVFVTISDVTAELEAKRSRVAHHDLLALVERFTKDPQGCREFVAEASAAVAHLQDVGDLDAHKRILHTLKGNCSTFGMRGFSRLLHELEDQLHDQRDSAMVEVAARVAAFWDGLGGVLGPLVGDPGTIRLPRAQLHGWLDALVAHDHRCVVHDLGIALTEPTGPRLQRLGIAARELAARLDKPEPDAVVRDGGVRTDPRQWAAVWAACTHLVRNCVDHGLEDASARVAAGKQAHGTVSLRTSDLGEAVVLEIRDDGAGIDWDRIRRVAASRGLATDTHEDLVDALFSDGLSTRGTVTATSGRGVGMAAVREALEAANGSIEVESVRGQGTTFRLSVPRRQDVAANETSAALAAS